MMNNNKRRSISPTFVISLTIFLSLLCYFCYQVVVKTGLIKPVQKNTQQIAIDTNQVKLDLKDSIIQLKDFEIQRLKEELLKKPDTVYLRPKPIIKKVDTTSLSISKVDSVK